MGLQRVISGRKFALVNTVLLIKMALFLIPLVLSLFSSEVRGTRIAAGVQCTW